MEMAVALAIPITRKHRAVTRTTLRKVCFFMLNSSAQAATHVRLWTDMAIEPNNIEQVLPN
jgi:hypothetical protein